MLYLFEVMSRQLVHEPLSLSEFPIKVACTNCRDIMLNLSWPNRSAYLAICNLFKFNNIIMYIFINLEDFLYLIVM